MVKLESLKKSNQFRKALKEKKIHTDYFSIFAAKNFFKPKHKANLLISFVMKKKIGNAVKRNKAKRIMRELAKKILIKGKTNSYYVLIAKLSILDTKFKTLLEEMESIIHVK